MERLFQHFYRADHFETFMPNPVNVRHASFPDEQLNPIGTDFVTHLGHGLLLIGVLDLIADTETVLWIWLWLVLRNHRSLPSEEEQQVFYRTRVCRARRL
jgi:hypothetical protein